MRSAESPGLPVRNQGPYRQAKVRADGQCEVMVQRGMASGWIRCPGWGSEIHYLLPVERGAKWLDKAWECYHLLVCCRHHSRSEHDPEIARLAIEGTVAWVEHRPFYQGPDEYLSERYGAR